MTILWFYAINVHRMKRNEYGLRLKARSVVMKRIFALFVFCMLEVDVVDLNSINENFRDLIKKDLVLLQ